jgi:lactate racemase
MKIRLPQLLWYENREAEFDLPDPWSVSVHSMKGGYAPCLSQKEMERAFANPVGTAAIREMAKGRKEVVIICDDLARSTPTHAILPYVLRELAEAGIEDRQIRFIIALGAHGAHTANDFRKKLGPEVLDRFPVFNHNPFGACTFLGTTSRGTPVSINSEVMVCDLKIAIGSIVPHPFSGFGGGGKIILPGVAHMDSITYNHGMIVKNNPGCLGLGKIEGNIPRMDIEEATKMAGLDVKIDALVNFRGEVAGLFVGDPILEHREGVKLARDFYATERAMDMDIVVANAYSKSNEALIGVESGAASLKKEGGDLVFIANEPAGQVVHYLFGEFGTGGGARVGMTRPGMERVKRLIAVMPLNDPFLLGIRRYIPTVIWVKTWQECLGLLREEWGERARVAVYPDATIQYFRQDMVPAG